MKYILASELACCGKAIISKISCKTNLNLLKNNLNDALNYIGDSDKIDDRIFAKDFNNITDDDFKMLMSSGYRNASYVKRQIKGYSSLFFMNKHFSKIKLEKICSLVFNNNYGNVIRVKGFYLNNDEWYLFNATKEEITKEKIDLGQDVVIIIGSSLNEEEINKLVNSI